MVTSYGEYGRGLINIRVETRGTSKGFRQPKGAVDANGNKVGGQFTSAQAGMRAKNERLADRIQARVVANIQERIQRRAVSSNRLVKVTADRKNRYADQFRIEVGIEDFLNHSIAKYWRTIEEGSAVVWADTPGGRSQFRGMKLRGYFGGTLSGMYENAWGMVPRGGSPITWIGQGSGGKFIPNKKARSRGKVKKEIDPMHAYRDAYYSMDVIRRSRANMRQYLEDITGLDLPD